MTSKCVCLLMTSSKSCSFGNEQTGTGRFSPDSLNRFRLCAISVPVVRRRFQPDLNQTHGQDNKVKAGWDVFRQHGRVYGRVG